MSPSTQNWCAFPIPGKPLLIREYSCFQIAELLKRNWTRSDIEGLTNKNLLRVMKGAEAVAKKLQKEGVEPVYEYYDKRTDLGNRRLEL